MDGTYKYPVLFECGRLLTKEEKKKIRRYFCNHRKSGGGECGPVSNQSGQVYRISFTHQKDQLAVLQRCDHVVEHGDVTLEFRVQADSAEQTHQSSSSSSLPPSGEEHELHLDTYLLRYLKECPKAAEDLDTGLSSLSCSAQLYPEDKKVLVRSLVQPQTVDTDDATSWKTEVNKLFERIQGHYISHSVVDPDLVSALLRSSSCDQAADDVKVYSEGTAAVVVGEDSQVKSRLSEIENKSHQSVKYYSLGEAKLRLLLKEIEHSLQRDFPGVKVTPGDGGQLVFEGAAEDIQKVNDWISLKENSVSERTVSHMSSDLLAFLKKANGGPGQLRDCLGFGDQVEIELQDTGLRIFSLLSSNLDETEKALQREFKEVNINNPTCSNVPCELSMELESKVNKMNQVECRVQVTFCSDSTVQLLGHAKEVEELNKAVTQFMLDHTVELPSSELALKLSELLQQHGFDCSGVTIRPLNAPSRSMVVLEGPSNRVTEARNKLCLFLDSLLQDRVTTDPFEAVSPSLRENHLNFQDHYAEPGKSLSSLCLSEEDTVVASYSLRGGFQVLVCQGDITKQETDALINAANEELDHCGGVAAALSKAGGPEVQRESHYLVKCFGRIPAGIAVVTTGGNLHCKKLLHAVGPVKGKVGGKESVLIEKAVRSALNLCEMMDFQSVALPCISSGSFGVSVSDCTEAIVTAVKKFGSLGGGRLSKVTLIDNRIEVVKSLQDTCDRLLQDPSRGGSISVDSGVQIDAFQDTATDCFGNSVRIETVEGTIEMQQVDAVVSPMVGSDPLSTRIGNALFETAGSQLIETYLKAAGGITAPGDSVLAEGLSGLPSNAVFFLNLTCWDHDEDGTAIQVLRLAINKVLTSCENRGFASVAFPVVGAGMALQFPDVVVARVLTEQVHEFERERASKTPFLIRIIIHPSDKEFIKAFRSVQETLTLEDLRPANKESDTKRIVLLGKTGSGKSSLGNIIFGDEIFKIDHTPTSGTSQCQAETQSVNGRNITLIDTPGLFDSERAEEDLKPAIMSCITECAPGPHAFVIVLKVEKFSEQEQAVISKICQYFSEEALKYTIIVFTHGNQLPKGWKIEDFISRSKHLSNLVKKCGNRYHVFDAKYWDNTPQNNYRSNQFQVEELLKTVDKMVKENNWGFYTNKMFEAMEKEIQKEVEEQVRLSPVRLSPEEVRKEAKTVVSDRILRVIAGTATGALLGALFGVKGMVGLLLTAIRNSTVVLKALRSVAPTLGVPAIGGEAAAAAMAAGVVAGVVAGGVLGGSIGYEAAEEAESVKDAVERACEAVTENVQPAVTKMIPLQLRALTEGRRGQQ